MSEKCPYCNNEMKKGVIHSDRYNLKWIPESKDKGAILSPLIKGKKLTNVEKHYLEVYHCEDCNKMIFEVE